ncbi:MAG: STAS/SEC14 domain-containing protein [Campylobacterales bacterium]|nr:STAS/SEC14 domain-containing protein [Campylobacterales bacterium]
MFHIYFDENYGVALIEPHDALSTDDFQLVGDIIDPYIEKYGKLNGLIIAVKSFPGWDSWNALVEHFNFVKHHRDRVKYVAVVTDSIIGEIAEHIASHFVNATIRRFEFDQLDAAKKWIEQESSKED